MGLMQREKGKRFERAIARDLKEAFPDAVVRRSQQAERAHEPDVVIAGEAPLLVKRLWLELKDGIAPAPLDALAQAERDSETRPSLQPNPNPMLSMPVAYSYLPVAVWHKLGSRTVHATLRLSTLNLLAHQRPVCRGDNLDGVVVTVEWGQLLDILKAAAPITGGGTHKETA